MNLKVFHIFPYSARLSGGHSNAIRGMIACQRTAGIEAIGFSSLETEQTSDTESLGEWIIEIPYDDPATIIARVIELAANKPSVIHLHSIDRFSTEISKLAKIGHLDVALTSHGQLNCRNVFHGFKKALYLAGFPSPVRYASGIHLLTSRESGRLHWMIPWFPGVTEVIPHVIDIPAETGSLAKAPCANRKFRILHMGRLDIENKGLDLLLEGFSKADLDQAQLIFAGPDWNGGRARLEAEAKAIGCFDQVVFPGPVYGEAKDELLRSADLFVAVSRWEAFGISLVEAMARDVPTLISDRLNLSPALAATGAAEVVGCNVESIASSLRNLFANPSRCENLAILGRSWVESNTSTAAVGSKFSDFYGKMLNSES